MFRPVLWYMEVLVTLEIVLDELIRLRESVDKFAQSNLDLVSQIKAVRQDTVKTRLAVTWGEARLTVTPKEVADELDVSYREVIRLIDSGYLEATRTHPGGTYRIDRLELERYKRERGIKTRRVV